MLALNNKLHGFLNFEKQVFQNNYTARDTQITISSVNSICIKTTCWNMCMGNNTSLKERIKISLCACSYFLPPNNIIYIYKGIIMLLNRNPLLSICRHNLTFTLSNFLFCHWYNGISQVCVSRFEPMPRNLYTGKTQNQSLLFSNKVSLPAFCH